MTLKEWKSRLQVGVQPRCSYRHYEPGANEVITIRKIQTNAVAWDYAGGSGIIKLSPDQLAWMFFPKKVGIRLTDDGFEPLKSDGALMSRYHWIEAGPATTNEST
jgi:hypothetical protein